MTAKSAPPSTTKNQSGSKNGSKTEQENQEEPQAKPAWITLGSLAGVATVILIAYGASVQSTSLLVVEILLGVTGLSIGGFFGFLFGMPRSPTETADDYKPSTNLEQVSDWLTKILIGAGLVQLGQLRDSLAGVGKLVAASHQPIPVAANVVSQLVVILYVVIGFLASFLWTRIYYGPIQALADSDLKAQLKEARETTKVVKLLATGKLTPDSAMHDGAEGLTKLSPAPGAVDALVDSGTADSLQVSETPDWQSVLDNTQVAEKVAKFAAEPVNWNNDPNAYLFPDATQAANGRRLEGEIVAQLDDAVVIRLRVQRVGGELLQGDVLFLLHPTFPTRIVRAPVQEGVAEITFYAEGSFTAVAIADRGKTVLSLNLSNLPGIPKWFRDK